MSDVIIFKFIGVLYNLPDEFEVDLIGAGAWVLVNLVDKSSEIDNLQDHSVSVFIKVQGCTLVKIWECKLHYCLDFIFILD